MRGSIPGAHWRAKANAACKVRLKEYPTYDSS
jgi:hypothetical protein